MRDTTLLPSVIVDPPVDSKVSPLEIFGPATRVYGFSTFDNAIQAANSLPTAFQASIFTRDLIAAERLDASAVMVNDHTAFQLTGCPSRFDVSRATASGASLGRCTT